VGRRRRSLLPRLPHEVRVKMNREVDRVMHPQFPDPAAVLVDSILHALIEFPDLETSLRKTIKYNLPHLLGVRKRGA